MTKIERLTPEQEADLPVFRQRYLDIATKGDRADRSALEAALADAYSEIGKPAPLKNGAHIVTHSETGHNHVIMERPGVAMFQDTMDMFRAWLVIEDEPAELEHLRSFDTHETVALEPGVWEVRRQREYSPEGWRRAAD